ncbi:Smr/MutS family protein [Gaetbulibacter aestuarii]|uniref:Smr/MutS family protein n=1 Tax=Gaetbulibacter aestuarii TaxID=1502358 RepID=A0ABW7N058_9FLAO
MDFKINDFVSVLDDDLSGTIKRIEGDVIYIETSEGFELSYHKNELIKMEDKSGYSKSIFSEKSLKEVVAEKEKPKRKPSARKKPKERHEAVMEVDLHIHQLAPSTKNMSNFDMLTLQLDTAKRKLEYAIANRIPKVVFIHGVGEGVLKLELEYLFRRYDNIKYYDANYQKYGLGATEIYIYQNPKN